MYATAVIVFREALEIAIVVGIVLAAARGLPRRNLLVSSGFGVGAMGALLVAAFAEAIAMAAAGIGQELFNATILLVAVVMLGWHNIWMSTHGRAMAAEIAAIGSDVRSDARPAWALAAVVAVAVLREGSEVVLFLYGIAAAQNSSSGAMLSGGIAGLALGVAAGAAMYLGLVRLTGRRLFQITELLILLLAAGMAGQAAKFLVQAGILPSLGEGLWDTGWLLSDRSAIGSVLHALIGYTARPSGLQVVFYIATLVLIGGLMQLFRRPAERSNAMTTVILCLVIAAGAVAVIPAAQAGTMPPVVEFLQVTG